MDIESLLEEALQAENPPKSLRNLARKLIQEGMKREEILQGVINYHVILMSKGRDSDDDILLELADALEGWCHPNVRI
jgi:hypothetical protein